MNKSSSDTRPTLSLYPNSYGIAFVFSMGPKDIIDFGIKKITPLTTRAYLKQAEFLLDYATPDVVIIRNPQSKQYRWSKQKEKMIEKVMESAVSRGLSVFNYNRDEIKSVFKEFGSVNKFAITRRLVSWYPFLKSKMPHYRTIQEGEHYQMGLFDAFALMATHHYLTD